MQFTFKLMDETDARTIRAWRYKEPYAVYNAPGDSDDFLEELDRRSPYYAVRDERDELVGFFGECNISGDGVARVIAESGRADTLVGVAVDSDPAEIEALRNGHLDALIVQTPYDQGYGAVMGIAEYYMEGIDGPDEVNMPAVVVTGENMDEPEMAALLDPTLLAR